MSEVKLVALRTVATVSTVGSLCYGCGFGIPLSATAAVSAALAIDAHAALIRRGAYRAQDEGGDGHE